MEGIGDIQHAEIERRKDRVRRVWQYRRVDHLPLSFFLDDFSVYSLREQCLSGEIQYKVNVRSIDRLLRLLPEDVSLTGIDLGGPINTAKDLLDTNLLYTAFYDNRTLQHWPGGRIHNCGPHPSRELYLDHEPPLNGLKCYFRYARDMHWRGES